jgi:hypothetical protein
MRMLPILLLAALLPACASRQVEQTQQADMFDYRYEFTGEFEGRPVNGTILFRPIGGAAMEYTLLSDAGLCTGELRPPRYRWVQLSCGGLSISFARSGRVLERADATLRTTRQVEQRECRTWTNTPNGQRVCSQWGTTLVDTSVTARGTVHLQRADGFVGME